MRTILVVDDDKYIRQLVMLHLKEEGFSVLLAEDGQKALDMLEATPCDMAVVDIMMPHIDGYELTEAIREYYDIPIILLTAKSQMRDKEKGFLSGTDDYLVKPFEPKELVYRIRALFRRYDKNAKDVITIGKTVISIKSYEVTVGEQAFILPLKEFELLFYLASHLNQVITREKIIERIWGYDFEGDERTVDVHIKRLRERFSNITDDFHIKTVRSVGYALEEAAS
ncbi:MAG TPA: response regulator transcription factor [Bacillota bacterium]|nr:response regulator transcription factor [Bacillota bacterium]